MASLESLWKHHHEEFEKLDKVEFNRLREDAEFVSGPLIGTPTAWGQEFGPYNPNRWAFGILRDGRKVCCDIAAEAGKEESDAAVPTD